MHECSKFSQSCNEWVILKAHAILTMREFSNITPTFYTLHRTFRWGFLYLMFVLYFCFEFEWSNYMYTKHNHWKNIFKIYTKKINTFNPGLVLIGFWITQPENISFHWNKFSVRASCMFSIYWRILFGTWNYKLNSWVSFFHV